MTNEFWEQDGAPKGWCCASCYRKAIILEVKGEEMNVDEIHMPWELVSMNFATVAYHRVTRRPAPGGWLYRSETNSETAVLFDQTFFVPREASLPEGLSLKFKGDERANLGKANL